MLLRNSPKAGKADAQRSQCTFSFLQQNSYPRLADLTFETWCIDDAYAEKMALPNDCAQRNICPFVNMLSLILRGELLKSLTFALLSTIKILAAECRPNNVLSDQVGCREIRPFSRCQEF